MRTSVLAASLTLAFLASACVIVPVPLPLPIGAHSWQLSADHATLSTGGLTLSCRPDGSLAATAESFVPVASNEEFSIGAGDEAFLLVADVAGATGPGVNATGPIPPGLLDALAAGGELTAVYGAERIGPRRPPEGLVARFVPACRARL